MVEPVSYLWFRSRLEKPRGGMVVDGACVVVCVCVRVCVFFVSIVRANRLTNEKTSACSRETALTHSQVSGPFYLESDSTEGQILRIFARYQVRIAKRAPPR